MRKIFALLSSVLLGAFSALGAAEIEGTLAGSRLDPGASVLETTIQEEAVLSGFYIRLANGVAPRTDPIVISFWLNGTEYTETAAIETLPWPAFKKSLPTVSGGPAVPFDVAREYRTALKNPVPLQKGDSVQLKIVSAEKIEGNVIAGLQFQGKTALGDMRAPFRESRTNGPICSIPWSEPEVIAVGKQTAFDPLCAPQNNSSVQSDPDGTLWQFTAYYSVDEQYGGGRNGSYSRVFGYKKAPGAENWELAGCTADLLPNSTYSGDPFAFRDLEGRPSLVFSNCDGTQGFMDWQHIGLYLIQSETDSFAGPWTKPFKIFDGYPREPDDNATGGRANCFRIFPRQKEGDYLFVWDHGGSDMDTRAVVMPNLSTELTHEQINKGKILIRNEEEGGGGFTFGDKGYLSTWQIPGINDPNGQQRVYEFDLNDPLNPTSVKAVPGSLGYNHGSNPQLDGGCTADAWAVSLVGDRLWATACEFSVTEKKNYLTARSCPVTFDENGGLVWPKSDTFRWGTIRIDAYKETLPTVEYALGKECSLEFDFQSSGDFSYGFIMLVPSESIRNRGGVEMEIDPNGTRLTATDEEQNVTPLTDYAGPKWESGKTYRLKLQRCGDNLKAFVNGELIQTAELPDKWKESLSGETRFRLYGWQGGNYQISHTLLTDGPED